MQARPPGTREGQQAACQHVRAQALLGDAHGIQPCDPQPLTPSLTGSEAQRGPRLKLDTTEAHSCGGCTDV